MEIVLPIVEGILTGLVLALMMGPVFFTVLQSSISIGFKAGLSNISGVILADFLFIILAIFSTSFLVFLEKYATQCAFVGALFLLGTSVYYYKKKVIDPQFPSNNVNKSVLKLITQGFLLNFLNPINFFIWLGIAITIATKFNFFQQAVYYTCALGAIFGLEIILAHFASKIKKWMTFKMLRNINITLSILFLIFGLFILFEIFILKKDFTETQTIDTVIVR